MSTQNRTGGGGGRNQKKLNSAGNNDTNAKKTEIKAEKEKSQPKPTAEQIRIAQITDCRTEDPKMREKVATLIEMTQRSEEEVCCALYECDNNLENAVNFLLETLPVGAFEISSKKRKNRTTNATTDGTTDGEWTETNNNTDNRERSRNRATTRSGRGGSDSRGWRGREARENERNASDSKGSEGGWRGGRNRGGSRGGYGGRGGKGGRPGPRGMSSRDSGRNFSRQQQDTQEVDTWDNAIATNAEQMKQPDAFSDAWGDWDNEEYVGSLKDTKVFTPSNLQTQSLSVISDLSTPPGLEQHMVNQSHITADDLVQQYSTSYSTTVVSSTTTAAAAAANSVQFADIHSANPSQHLRLGLDAQQMNASSTLSAEQSQYFNSLQSQGSNQQTNVNSYQNSSVQYQTPYVSNNVFGDQNVTSQPSVRRARAKVPPPSKIPATAVEMPGDTLNNIYLDVQFGGLDFAAEESFDALSEKFNATTIDGQQNVQSQEVSTDFQPKSSQQTSLPTALQTSQMIPNSDTLSSSQTDPLSSSYSQRTSGNVSQQVTGVSSTINASGNNTLDQLSKSDPYNQSNASNTTGYQNSYNSSSSTNKSTSYQSSGSTQGYNSANYTTNTQVKVSSGNNYQPSSNSAYNTYNQNSVNSYQQQNNASANNSSNSTNSTANSSNAAQNIPVGGSTSAVNNTGSSSNTGYLSNQYQSNQTSSAFPSQQSGYQNSQSVYGTTGLTNNTGFSGSTNTSSSQYSNFSSTKLKETSASASTHFDSVSNVTSSSTASSSVSSVSSSSVTTNSMSSPSLGLANTKVTNSTAKNTAGILPNIQMVSQFIQPYYQQPALYSYEDIQMMQQRMPHVTQYYDINYPPTSLGAAGVRDANLGSVAYSAMDGRFARTENNSSPVSNVSSTMSQQAGSSGPMLNVPYAYFYGGNMMPGGFQYGTPAIYPQQMPAANATSGGQFAKPSYNSGYGSTSYDALSQATQDYSKGAYAGSSVSQQSKTQAVTNPPQAASASDITSSMYGKSHVALNKVNSYEKQSFHSGTPPPFNLTGTQTAAATSAQPYGMYIQPMPATHHNMNIHPTMHQDSSSTGQRQQPSSQNKSGTKQGYSPSTYWTAQN